MRAILAVVTALFVLILGWLLVAGLLYLMGIIAIKARPQAGLLLIVHIFLIWVLSPGAAGYLAIFVTSRLFRSVPIPTLYVSFVSVVGVLSALLFLIGVLAYSTGHSTLGEPILLVFQAAAILVGARIARGLSEERRLPHDT
jgi:hypothetical protein